MAYDEILTQIKIVLAAGLASIFDFTVLDSIKQTFKNKGKIPFPTDQENVLARHALMAVGYDDNLIITNEIDGSQTTGTFLIRNS